MGGIWLVRLADAKAGGGYRQSSLGRADDVLKATGTEVLDFRQAEAKAREWIAKHHRAAAGLEPAAPALPTAPYTVLDALRDYLEDFAVRGGKSVAHTRRAAEAHILPTLGTVVVTAITREQIKTWHRGLAAAQARVRAKAGLVALRPVETDADAPRRRSATANRVLTIFKAALNHARAEGRVTGSDDAWSSVKPFREADKAKVRYLLDEEVVRLVNACSPDFRALVTGALLTGCRYGELTAMRAGDLDPRSGTVTIERAKSGRPRHVVLTDEGRAFFERQAAGKPGSTMLFERDLQVKPATRETSAETKRAGWGGSHQFRPLREACRAARIAPAVSFHILRHTYASRLARSSAPMAVIAAQLGHTDTRMTEKHYAHLSPSYVADMVRQTFGSLGIGEPPADDSIVPLRARSV